VLALIDEKSVRNDDGSLQYSRQRVASFLTAHAGSRVGGYSLNSKNIGPESAPVAHYKLANASPTPSTSAAAE